MQDLPQDSTASLHFGALNLYSQPQDTGAGRRTRTCSVIPRSRPPQRGRQARYLERITGARMAAETLDVYENVLVGTGSTGAPRRPACLTPGPERTSIASGVSRRAGLLLSGTGPS